MEKNLQKRSLTRRPNSRKHYLLIMNSNAIFFLLHFPQKLLIMFEVHLILYKIIFDVIRLKQKLVIK